MGTAALGVGGTADRVLALLDLDRAALGGRDRVAGGERAKG